MLKTKPTSAWEGLPLPQQQPRVQLRKPRKPVAVYNLGSRKVSKFFGYVGQITLLCLLGGLVYSGFAWSIHRSHSIVTVVSPEPADPSSGDDAMVAVAADLPQGPQIDYVRSWGITKTSASISWSTNMPATTLIDYGTTANLGQSTPLVKALTSTHGASLTGLKPATTYYFVPRSVGADGTASKSTTYTFTTNGITGTGPAPTITDVVVRPDKNHQLKISWKTSVAAYSYVQLGLTTKYDRWSTRTDLTKEPHPVFNWVPSGVIHYQLVSTDANGNKASSPDRTFVEP